jgi:uncharacterized protein (TIGR04255 family)
VTSIRPNFKRPPLQEQAISVVFQPLDRFRIVDYGLFWAELTGEFPEVTTDAPLEAPMEQFDNLRPAGMSFQFLTAPPLPRAKFRNPDNGELVQLQNNRFGFNWAKVGDQPYPRSEPLMARFKVLFARFSAYARKQNLGELALKQCELTNLNFIPVSDFGDSYSDVHLALRVDAIDLGMPDLQLEFFERSRQHKILGADGQPIGRLHTVLAPVISNVDNSQGIRYELTARSAQNIRTIADAEHFFAIARNTINGAFMASVTDAMKERWGEQHVN